MSSSVRPGPTPGCAAASHIFSGGEKCEKPLHQRVQEKPKMTLRDPGLAENLDDLHLDQETAPKTLLNSVHGVNLEDLHQNPGLSTICSAVKEKLCPRRKP